jgi:hypothetical protein
MMKIEVRLLLQKIVEVVLPPPWLPLPGDTAEHGEPVVWRGSIWFRVGPDIPVRLGAVATDSAFVKPRVLVGGMGVHLIDDHLQFEIMSACEQAVEVLHGAEHRIDAAVVGDVITEVLHRRREKRR